MHLKNPLKDLEPAWASITKTFTAFFATVSVFVIGPPQLDPTGTDMKFNLLSEFIVLIVLASAWVMIRQYGKRVDVGRIAMLSLGALVCGIVLIITYFVFRDLWACDGITMGDLTSSGSNYFASQKGNATCTTLMEDFPGRLDALWERDSRIIRQYTLVVLYILTILSFSMASYLVTEAVIKSSADTPRAE